MGFIYPNKACELYYTWIFIPSFELLFLGDFIYEGLNRAWIFSSSSAGLPFGVPDSLRRCHSRLRKLIPNQVEKLSLVNRSKTCFLSFSLKKTKNRFLLAEKLANFFAIMTLFHWIHVYYKRLKIFIVNRPCHIGWPEEMVVVHERL